jgi:hypothetical protein
VVTAAIFPATTGGTRLHPRGGRPIQSRRHQAPGLAVPRHRDDEARHRDFWPADRPPAPPVCVPERAAPALAPTFRIETLILVNIYL